MNNHENSNINIKKEVNKILMIDSNKNLKKRIEYFDWLRVFCSFSVIIIHVASQNRNNCPVRSREYKIFNFYDGISRFGVQIFLMISGTLFLGKNISFIIMIKKYIKRIYFNIIFWSFLFSFREKIINNYNYKKTFLIFLNGHYHLWYLFCICGLYLITPFLREIAKNDYLLNIFVILNFIFGFLISNFHTFLFYFSTEFYDSIEKMLKNIGLNDFFNTNLFFYIFGFYLNKTDIRPLFRIIIYILGICGMIFSFKISYYVSTSTNFMNVFFTSIAVFIFFKSNFSDLKKNCLKKFIQKLGLLTFGIYIIHPFIIEELNERIKFNTFSYEPLYSVPINSLIIFLISTIIVYFIKLIPFINQFIF